MKTTLMVSAFLAVLGAVAPDADAALIAYYDNPLKDSSSLHFDSGVPIAPLYVLSGATASELTNTGVTGVDHIEMYQTNGWTSASEPDLAQYISFSVGPADSNMLLLESLSVDVWFGNSENARGFALRSSQDAFASDLFAIALNPPSGPYRYDIPLTSMVPILDATEFRLYFHSGYYGLLAMGSTGDGIRLNGSAAPTSVLEPSAAVLMLGGLLAACAVLRSRARGAPGPSPLARIV